MGIGNTAAASALTAAFCCLPAREVTHRSTGLDDETLGHKIGVLEKALALPHAEPLGVLTALDGLEIAAICDYDLAASSRRVPVIFDGFIRTAGALVASRLCPAATAYFLVGHGSKEIGHAVQCRALGKTPLLNLGLRLGEGTGATIAVQLVRTAVAIYNEMAPFATADVFNEEVPPT